MDYQIECIIRGEQRPTQKKTLVDKEKRIMTIVNDQENRSVMDFLRDIAHNLSL